MKKHIPIITIFTIIIAVIALAIWYSDKDSPIKQLAKLNVYSKEELSFLEKEGFLDALDSENLPDNKEQIVSLLKSVNLIEQNLNSPDESFEVLATKLDENTYQLAFKLENKSNQSKEFYLIPISDESQLQFKEIKGSVKGKAILGDHGDWAYDIEKHKQELRPELAQAYDDIEKNGYTGKPIKLVLEPNSTLIAQSKWEIGKGRGPSSTLEPIYLLVYGSAGGAKDDLDKDISFEQSEHDLSHITGLELADKLNKAPQEIRAEYVLEDASFKKTDIKNAGLTKKGEVKDKVEVKVGGKDEFKPKVEISLWDEVNFSVELLETETGNPSLNFDKDKIKWSKGNIDVEYYDYSEGEGGYKMVWFLKEKPATNKVEFSLQSKGVKFYYQPPLTQKEKDEGAVRPENVVGSYAVYHESKGGMNDINSKDYKAGKVGHIFRPRLKDSNGWEVWGNLKIQGGLYEVEIPEDFYNKAVYPIKSNDTFGWDTIGETYNGSFFGFNMMSGSLFLADGSGTADSITFWVGGWAAGEKLKAGLYEDGTDVTAGNGGTFLSPSTEEKSSGAADGTEITFNFTSGPSITEGKSYYIVGWGDELVGSYYDAVENEVMMANWTPKEYNSFPSSYGGISDLAGYRLSIYATYTPAAAEATSTRIKGGFKVKGGLKIKF